MGRPAPRRLFRLLAAVIVLAGFAGSAPAQLSWNVTFADTTGRTGFGFDDAADGAARRNAVYAALATISSQFDGRGTIQVTVAQSERDASGPVASANTTFADGNGFQNGTVYRRATTDTSLFPGTPDATATFDFGYQWSTSGSAGGYDLQTVALHEFTHALGFGSQIAETGQGGRDQPLGQPDLYNSLARYFQVGSGPDAVPLIRGDASFNVSQASPADLTGHNVTFAGPIATAANGGVPVAIYAPSTFDPGSSLSHVDPSARGAEAAVMQPTISPGNVRHSYQAFEVGMLIDAGWNQYTWSNVSGNWGANTQNAANSPWRNADGKWSLSPTGVVTPNVVLTFAGSQSVGYRSTNDLNLSSTGDRFFVNRIVLNSTSAGTNTIAAAGGQVLRFDTTLGVTPQIVQQNVGAFNVSHPLEMTSAGLTLAGNGTGVATLSGTIAAAARASGTLTKTGTSEFVLAGANTYAGHTALDAGTLRVANSAGSATGTGTVTVGSHAVLAGLLGQPVGAGGFITGNVTVASGGVVRPGEADAARAGQITFAGSSQTVAFNPGSVYEWSLVSLTDLAADAGLGYDQIVVTNGNGLRLGGQVELAFNAGTAPTTGNAFWSVSHLWTLLTVISGTNQSSFAGLANARDYYGVGLFTLQSLTNGGVALHYTPGAFTPVPVPEPASVLGVAAAGLGLAVAVRRRFVSRPA